MNNKQFNLFLIVSISITILMLGSLIVTISGYSTIGKWMNDIGSAFIALFLMAEIRLILKLQRMMKWKHLSVSLKASIIAYYIVAVAAVIASIFDYGVRPLSSVIVALSAILYTMVAMANFTPQTDSDNANSIHSNDDR